MKKEERFKDVEALDFSRMIKQTEMEILPVIDYGLAWPVESRRVMQRVQASFQSLQLTRERILK